MPLSRTHASPADIQDTHRDSAFTRAHMLADVETGPRVHIGSSTCDLPNREDGTIPKTTEQPLPECVNASDQYPIYHDPWVGIASVVYARAHAESVPMVPTERTVRVTVTRPQRGEEGWIVTSDP